MDKKPASKSKPVAKLKDLKAKAGIKGGSGPQSSPLSSPRPSPSPW